MFGGRPRGIGFAGPILVNGQVAGVVVANPRSTLQQLGPTLFGVGVLLVCLGIASAAVLVFGPVRRRLSSLEDAARQVGGGDLGARAREDGGDEVAALAHAFNQMAADLQTRAAQLQSADRTRREYSDGSATRRSAERHDLRNGEQTPAQRVKTNVSNNGLPPEISDKRTSAPSAVFN